MKKIIQILFILIFHFSFFNSLWAQSGPEGYNEVNDCLRFMPTRVTNGVRTVREYRPSTVVMGARELLATTHYDRHGYMTYQRRGSEMPDTTERTYDSLGRLVQWCRAEHRWDDDSQRMVWGTLYVESLEYTPDGLVSLDQLVVYDRVGSEIDTSVVTYTLVHLARSTGMGITECDYAYYERESAGGVVEERRDNCRFRREYDERGRLVRESYTDDVGSRGLDNYEVRYAYDVQDRIQYERNYFYGGSDSLGYRYSALGGVVEKSGKSWVQGIESDIFYSCRPDGSPLESTEISYPQEWDYGENPEQRGIIRKWYDAMGSVIREEGLEGTLEYDVEYWEN